MQPTQPQGPGARADAPRRAERARLACVRVWLAVGVVVLAAVAILVLWRVSSVLLFLAVGSLVAYVASPLVNWLDRHHVPRGLAALLGVVTVVAGVVLLFALLVPLLLSQMTDLLRELPARIADMGSWLASLEREYDVLRQLGEHLNTDELLGSVQGVLGGVVSTLLSAIGNGFVPAVSNIASAVFLVFLGLVFAYWLVCDYPTINDEVCRVLGPRRSHDYRVLGAVVSRSVGGYLRSTVINSLIQGVLASIGFHLAGHPYAGVMGVLSGVLNFVPIVGPTVSAAIATVVALLYSPVMAFWTLVASVLSQNLTDNVIVPRINQSTMQIHPVLSLTALVLGSALLGTLGMVVALPLCAIAKGVFVFYFESRTGTQVVSHDGALFRGTPFVDADGAPVPACDAVGDDRFADSRIAPADEMGAPDATAVPRPKQAWERALEHIAHGEGLAAAREGDPDGEGPAPEADGASPDGPRDGR